MSTIKLIEKWEHDQDVSNQVKDYLWSYISINDRGIRAEMNRMKANQFKKFTVVKIIPDKKYDNIGIMCDGGKKMSWVTDKDIITEKSLKVKI